MAESKNVVSLALVQEFAGGNGKILITKQLELWPLPLCLTTITEITNLVT